MPLLQYDQYDPSKRTIAPAARVMTCTVQAIATYILISTYYYTHSYKLSCIQNDSENIIFFRQIDQVSIF